MRQIQEHIARRKADFAKLPFFVHLEGPATRQEVEAFVPGLTFFVFAFQDILRLNADRVQDPVLKRIAAQHRDEDRHHELWFLNDLEVLGREPRIGWVFGSEHRVTRDASFTLISEVYHSHEDRVRIALPLALEATGDVFFSRVDSFLDRARIKGNLMYFSRGHHEVELAHEMFEDQQQSLLSDISLTASERTRCLDMVNRIFGSMEVLAAELYRRVSSAQAAQRAS